MNENAKQIMEKVMKHLDCLSSKFRPKSPVLNMQRGGETPRGLVDHSPRDEDPVETLHRLCGEHLLHKFFTDLGRKHPKRA